MTILSIQSHVVYGYVGNRAAVFPLQRMGHDVIAVNTVQFSNHTGYGHWKGEVFSASHVASLLEGLEDLNVLSSCEAILSGYLGDQSIGKEIITALTSCRSLNPKTLYLCDPVMGDVGRGIFVRPDIPEFMRTQLVPHADILTPNHFEMELLASQEIKSIQDAKEACERLRSHPSQVIAITSFRREMVPEGVLEVFLSTPQGNFLAQTPYLSFQKSPNGTGDLFSALLLGNWLKTQDFPLSLEKACSSIFDILAHTHQSQQREMQLIKAQDYIIEPQTKATVQAVD